MFEIAVVLVVYLGYRQVRSVARDQATEAFTNARRIVDLERRFNVFTERTVQEFALRHEELLWFANHYYARVHFPITLVFLVWLLIRHREMYRTVRTWLIGVTLVALVLHVAFPLAPPRMLRSLGFVDTLRAHGLSVYSANPNQSVANQFAAMPSLHFGWAVIVATGFVAVKRTWASAVAIVHPFITLVAIVATANHFWIDAGVALLLVIGMGRLVIRRDQRRRRRAPIGRRSAASPPFASVPHGYHEHDEDVTEGVVMSTEQREFRGLEVIDADGEVIGTVSDVFYDDHADAPTWFVIKSGLLRKKRLVPVEGSHETDDGRLVLPYDKQWVTNGPTVRSEYYPDAATTQLAAQHYQIEA